MFSADAKSPFIGALLALALAPQLLSCKATSSPPPRSLPASTHPIAHSSIESILMHGGELGLTAEQTSYLRALDDRLTEANEAIRMELAKSAVDDATRKPIQLSVGGGGPGGGGPGGGGPGGAGPGGGGPGGGGPGGGGPGGAGPGGGGTGSGGGPGGGEQGGGAPGGKGPPGKGPRGTHTPAEADRTKLADQRMDENDTAAFLQAEFVLTESQIEKAREIAARYRYQLWKSRRGEVVDGEATDGEIILD